MIPTQQYGEFETAWCPGCGNFSINKAVKKALSMLDLAPHRVLICSGIGQAAKSPHYLRCNCFNGLHGRSLPPAQGAALANTELTVFAESGDGCSYGEGGNHFLAAMRRNVTMTYLVHDNQIYGLTKGQASPTTAQGQTTKFQPGGVASMPFNPVAVAVTMDVPFVARAYAAEADHLADLIVQAARHPGFALVDILQPCVSFNKVNTYAWYKQRCYKLGPEYDPTDWASAMRKAQEFGDQIPIGVIYKGSRPPFEGRIDARVRRPLATSKPDLGKLAEILETYA
ncbi:MAG: 2-oxoacid ferredoxin oxidoreductase [Desulfovibrio sp.]|jgi:2-oxoglutarate ferredoxin oxidoreductase subunit beta|nr:2-oxoacid ferredoxin oxidoreductase [Desulfovibrio sp.]MBI4958782.1 2-oxoacid ferredoxin oxidoreductase [Desulfovibrio sp.]